VGEKVKCSHPCDKLLRVERLPHIWCPGCGIGIVLHMLIKAIDEANLDPKNVVVISGIGCSGRFSGYIKTDGAHVLHGRAIPFAIGVKLANPKLTVIVVGGDGDIVSIGGNHLIHAARRNIDLKVIMINNMIYGMTGGQLAPTTPKGAYTTTSPQGNIEEPINAVALAAVSGATFVSRWTVAHPINMKECFKKALKHRGFSFIEVVSDCPEIFGRLNGIRNPSELIRKIKLISKIRNNIDPRDAHMVWDKEIICGDFLQVRKPTLEEEMGRIRYEV